MSTLTDEIARRRTFAIISHPDAGKTTLTEKLLLFGGALQLAGEVKARGERRRVRSDWMAVERERGISVSSAVMSFEHEGLAFNLLERRRGSRCAWHGLWWFPFSHRRSICGRRRKRSKWRKTSGGAHLLSGPCLVGQLRYICGCNQFDRLSEYREHPVHLPDAKLRHQVTLPRVSLPSGSNRWRDRQGRVACPELNARTPGPGRS